VMQWWQVGQLRLQTVGGVLGLLALLSRKVGLVSGLKISVSLTDQMMCPCVPMAGLIFWLVVREGFQ
jgi:hypothetical protein